MKAECVWKAEDVIHAVRGKCLHEQSWTAHGVSIDSRTLKPGDLFVALIGPTHNGHDHVAAAFVAGAAAAIVMTQPQGVSADVPLVFVEDSEMALENLGRFSRYKTGASIVAVTGSVGKTGAKEMLRLMLSAVGDTFASEGNLNNHLGVPLSMARMPPAVRFGVFELGMNHAGELSFLSRLLLPHVALITTVEAVHLEFFPSVEAIADAKAEIFYGMKSDDIVVLNRDNIHHGRLTNIARAQGIRRIYSFGHDTQLEGRLLGYAPAPEGGIVQAEILGKQVTYKLGAHGEHIAFNSIGALLAAVAAGGDLEACATALAQYRSPKGRGMVEDIPFGDGTVKIIDESYNASPASVRATIRVLQQMPGAGRRILVLGDMKELGASSAELHASLAIDITGTNIDKVFCCGEMMEELYDALTPELRGGHAHHNLELAAKLVAELKPGDTVAIKGSHSMRMDMVIDAVKKNGKTDL